MILVKLQEANLQKSVLSLYSYSKLPERESKKTTPFTSAWKKKYLGINLTEEMKKKSAYKTIGHWWKKLKKIQINRKTSYSHGLEKLTLLKCAYYPMWSTESMQSLSKYEWYFS